MHAISTRLIRAAATVFAALAFVATAALAQTITGSIRGTVTDSSGAVLPGASVTATNVSTGVHTATLTDKDGDYNIQFLPVGTYTVTVTASGFTKTSIAAFTLEIDQIAKIDAKLQVGSATMTVEVSSEVSPLLQTQNSTTGATIDSEALENVPNNGLNFQFDSLFVPGAVNPSVDSMAAGDGNERDIDPAGVPSFNGNRQQGNNYVLDGIEMNETMNNLAAYNPAPDSMQEERVITGNADAEYGNVNGGEILVVTRSGSNHYHGSTYLYYQDNNLASANSWYNNYYGLPITPFTQEQFGATIGGPILKNKLFLFGDYEGFRYHSGGVGQLTVATPDMRNGDFHEIGAINTPEQQPVQLYNTYNGGAYNNATPYGNCATSPATCNQIPVNNPVAKFLFSHPEIYPLPNHAPVGGYVDLGNYWGPFKGQTHNNQGDVRVDYTIGAKDSLMGRYTDGDAYDLPVKSTLAITFPTANDYPFQSLALSWIHTFSPALQNEFRAGVSRAVWLQGEPYDATGLFGNHGDTTIGIPFPQQSLQGFSQMNISSDETTVGTTAIATQFHENNFFYSDNLTWQHGTHNTKFGAQIVRYQQNSFYPGNAGALGSFGYNGQYTANSTVGAPGYGFADFVLDESDGDSVGGVAGPVGYRQYRNAVYAQDDWRLRPNLTVNLGLRYGYDQPLYEVNNKEANIINSDLVNPNPTATITQIVEYAGKNGASRALYNPVWTNFMPRVGFALQAGPKLVFRGGYGITDWLEGTGANLRLSQNPPFLSNFSFYPPAPTPSTPGGPPVAAENGFNTASGSQVFSYGQFNAWTGNLRPALVQQFNLAWQYLLNSNTTAQVGYVGQLGQHLVVPEQANQWSTPATFNLLFTSNPNDCSGTIEPAAPFCGLVGNFGNIYVTQSEGFSNYNAMQASLHHRANGMEYTLNYTWSRSMTDNAGFYGVASVTEYSSFYQNIYDPKGDYGPAGYDTRNSLNAYGVFHLPFGRGRKFGSNWSRAMDEALGGWQLSGDAILYSGFPMTMYGPMNYNVWANENHVTFFRPLHAVHRSLNNWFGTDPSATPCLNLDANGNPTQQSTLPSGQTVNGECAYGQESANYFGNAQNGSERAPGYRKVDVGAFKVFSIAESQSLELRGEAFNVGNIASYAQPDTWLPDAEIGWLGKIVGTVSTQRILQVSMHYRF
ncbi:MAG TPA: carboxypeptidase regulatory-like domain-containing protein [Acidobacteriaceae bacterium]|nr:carboxypeptidase regulatory-like domain-containing protein [Acidobacteriaceae bacterium]